MLSVRARGAVWHSEIRVSRREYSMGEALTFRRLGDLVGHLRREPLMLRSAGERVKVLLREAIPKRMVYKIQSWYIPHLHEEDVNRYL